MEKVMIEYNFSGVIGHDEDGYWGYCPEPQGCYVQAETYEEAIANLREAITLHVEDRLARGEKVPESDSISLISLKVAV